MDKAELKKLYHHNITEEKKQVADLDKEIVALKKAASGNAKLLSYYKFSIVSKMLRQIELKLQMNVESEKILGIKNIAFLDLAKKTISAMFTELSVIVPFTTGSSLDGNRENLNKILKFNARQRLYLHKYCKYYVEQLIEAYGDNTKWKWSFPEFRAKVAILGKNIFDFREYQRTRDPRMEFYYDLQEHVKLIKEDLFYAATEYANKYRISTKSTNDMNYAIALLDDLRRICSIVGDDELLKKSKAGIDSYKATLEAEEKNKNKQAKI